MAFHDVSLPDGLQYGSVAGAGFNTIIQETSSGHEYRVARQSQGRHRFRLLKELQSQSEALALKNFALGRRGAKHSFRLKDFSDSTTRADGISAPSAIDQILGTGDGTTQTFQIIKAYDPTGADPYSRVIQLPVTGTVLCALNTTSTTAFTVNGQGQVTFATAPASGVVITCGCEFDVPVRFEREFDAWAGLQADAFQTWSLPQMGCVEVLSEIETPDRWYAGGATMREAVTSDVTLSLNDGSLQWIEADASINVWLPPVSRIAGGPGIFYVHVPSTATGSAQVKDEAGNNIGAAITAGGSLQIGLVRSGSTAKWWAY